MGYYVTTTHGEFVIPADKCADAYRAVVALNDRDELKSGGSYGGENDRDTPRPDGLNYHPGRWFSWMPANYPETSVTVAEVFLELGFSVVTNDKTGDVHICGYDDKVGDEIHFLAAIAPYCTEASFFQWRGEQGEMWATEVRDGKLWELDAMEVQFHNPREYQP